MERGPTGTLVAAFSARPALPAPTATAPVIAKTVARVVRHAPLPIAKASTKPTAARWTGRRRACRRRSLNIG